MNCIIRDFGENRAKPVVETPGGVPGEFELALMTGRRLGVEPQQVVRGESEAADGRFGF
jgi:predicted oxidoreductase